MADFHFVTTRHDASSSERPRRCKHSMPRGDIHEFRSHQEYAANCGICWSLLASQGQHSKFLHRV